MRQHLWQHRLTFTCRNTVSSYPESTARRRRRRTNSACVYFPFRSGRASSAAEREDEDGESKWEEEGFLPPPDTLCHSAEGKVSSFLSSPTSFCPSFPFHPFAKKKKGKKRTEGCSSEEEQRRRKEDRQLRRGGMRCCFCLLSGSEQLQSARWGSSLYSSHPSRPFPACLRHMSPPLVAMATPPHVADRMGKKRGRGGDSKAEGKGRVGEAEMEGKKKGKKEEGRKTEEPRVREEKKATKDQNKSQARS